MRILYQNLTAFYLDDQETLSQIQHLTPIFWFQGRHCLRHKLKVSEMGVQVLHVNMRLFSQTQHVGLYPLQ